MGGSGKLHIFSGSRGENTAREHTSTLAIGVAGLLEEGPTGQFPATPGKALDTLRERLSRCRVMASESGIATGPNIDDTFTVYSTLSKRVRGAWPLKIDDARFIIGRTKSTWFLLYDRPPESFYEDARFMNIDLKKRDVLTLDNGKTMFLSRVSRTEIDMLNTMANLRPHEKKPQHFDTLVPRQDGSLSYSAIKWRLRAATSVRSEDLVFDMRKFADGIKFITTMEDDSGGVHYYIVSGEEERSYWLYVNSSAPAPEGALYKTTFTFHNDKCVLYRED